jgi:serine/threonine protein phosphatase PrpC
MIVASDGIWDYISSQVRVNELSMWSYNDLVAMRLEFTGSC